MQRSKSTHRIGVPGKALATESLINDDSAEKRARREERVANKHLERKKVVAAAATHGSPLCNSMGTPGTPPRTPNGTVLQAVDDRPHTPVRKVPILANFEEWMKMATDNKINATNSWNFALIDYFHDMSLLRDGDSINFQKASCTLDGCVKIYTSRVDSVASETGKLLSGLSDSQSKRVRGSEEGDEEEDGNNEEQREKKARKRAQRAEATLVKDFNTIQLKKFDLEFSVDPLFKKTSADFDEGGAKGLLLNHLSLDGEGRIVFDAGDTVLEEDEQEPAVISQEGDLDLDLGDLQVQFFPDLQELDDLDICPSLKNFEFSSDKLMDLPFLKLHSDANNADEPDEYLLADRTVAPFGDDEGGFGGDFGGDDDGGFGGHFHAPDDAEFGKGGENWADASIMGDEEADGQGFEPLKDMNGVAPGQYVMALSGEEGENILSYFDEQGGKNWAGPEHWRIQRIKKAAAPGVTEVKKTRKEKEVFEIDFFATDEVDEDILFSTGGASINLPKTQWKSKSRNLLPDDMNFNSKQLLRLFLKPKAMLHAKKSGSTNVIRGVGGMDPIPEDVDERYWAEAAQRNKIITSSSFPCCEWRADGIAPEAEHNAGYDADFFADNDTGGFGDVDDGEMFTDAREHFSPGAADRMSIPEGSQSDEFGSLLRARRARPDYVNYAKTAKKVDVKKLKDNLWTKLDIPEENTEETQPRKFTDVIRGLDTVYPEKALADISTSFCFICLLHLANEKGLKIEGNNTLDELSIIRDITVEGTDSF